VLGGVGLWNSAGQSLMLAEMATLNAAATLLQYQHADVATVALSGAVGRSLWRALVTLANQQPGLRVVVNDGTRLFVEAGDLTAFDKQGARLMANRGIHMTGITLNPFSPLGGSFDAAQFLASARAAFEGYGVSDVMLEPQMNQTKELA
jgi:hypothetical protein